MNAFLAGIILGIVLGVFLGSKVSGDEIVNEIGKIKTKGDNSPIDSEQTHDVKRKGFLKRIFTKKL